ncbi:hypothetical protein CP49_22010 [Bradyrhizobium valentinum]|uniref:Integrase catalytic domain-containing protein n=1 Tax=Bradyrhizobium valentinum TaxID=1518501 RepID=A0A0R3LUC3_9BRAD|nr:hypothetical protein CP49_22010 [Bradyrhizobium valentinum]
MPAKPTQNTSIESFNARVRDELLNETLFTSLAQVRAMLAAWKHDYNNAGRTLANLTLASMPVDVRKGAPWAPVPFECIVFFAKWDNFCSRFEPTAVRFPGGIQPVDSAHLSLPMPMASVASRLRWLWRCSARSP